VAKALANSPLDVTSMDVVEAFAAFRRNIPRNCAGRIALLEALELWVSKVRLSRLRYFGDRGVERDVIFSTNGFSQRSGARAVIGLPRPRSGQANGDDSQDRVLT
jgi:hypothetical protein